MEITRQSQITGLINTLDIAVTVEQINNWQGGTLIQEAMPNISMGEREFIKSGITPQEWKDTFGSCEC